MVTDFLQNYRPVTPRHGLCSVSGGHRGRVGPKQGNFSDTEGFEGEFVLIGVFPGETKVCFQNTVLYMKYLNLLTSRLRRLGSWDTILYVTVIF